MSMSSSVHAVLPIIIVAVTGMLVLVGDACLSFWRNSKRFSAAVALIGILVAALQSLRMLTDLNPNPVFGGAVTGDSFAQACNMLLLVSAGIGILLAVTYLENRDIHLAEYYVLILFSAAGAMLMAGAQDLIVLFIALETLSICLYVLAGFARTEARSEEAALKYFLLGAFAAGFLLYGIALIYGGSGSALVGGTTNLTQLHAVVSAQGAPSIMLIAGIALLLVGLGFKAALVPFHQWTPDVYQGAPTSVTAYMAAAAKIGAFAAILRIFTAFIPISSYWLIALEVLAVITMFAGNILAILQDNVKRMLAYSSIAHAGYVLVAVCAAVTGSEVARGAAYGAAIYYLLAYTLMTMGAFGVLIWLTRRGRDIQTLNDLKGLARTDPVAAYSMLVFMLSLGGIPPTMGFMGKWFIFFAALSSGLTWLAILLGLASVISIYYYLRVVWMMCFLEPDIMVAPRAASPAGVGVALFITVFCVLLFGLVPGLIHPLMVQAAGLLHL